MHVPDEILDEIWEGIIRKNGKESNNRNYEIYFSAAKKYSLLVNEYNLVKACILKLIIRMDNYDMPVIELLRARGYKINISSRSAYIKSIEDAQSRSNNLVTKIIAKQKELSSLSEKDGEPITFHQAAARLNAILEWKAIDNNSTLAEYNELKKIALKKNGRNRQAGFNKR